MSHCRGISLGVYRLEWDYLILEKEKGLLAPIKQISLV